MARRPPSLRPRRLLARLRGGVGDEGEGDALRAATLRVIDRAERLFERLDGAAHTLERVAAVELQLLERLVPIVEDLGELVKLGVLDARRRLGVSPAAGGSITSADADTEGSEIIDTELVPPKN